MPNRSVAVTLTANISGFTAAMAQAAASAKAAGVNIAKAVDGHEQSLNRIGNAAIGMGGLILAGVGLAVKTFADFDQEMSNVQAATHETDANMARLRDTAMQLGADTIFSAREAAQGMEELAKAGVSTNDIIGGGLKGSLDLAAAGGLSVAESAETAATALTQFGLAGADVPHVADLLAAGAGKAQGSVHDLGMALKQSGLVASQYGISIEETTGALAAFASAGLIGSDAGTSFKTMLMSLAAPSTKAQQVMDQLGISAYDSSGHFRSMTAIADNLQSSMSGLSEAERNAAMATIFGTDAVRAANVLYSQGQTGIQGWIDKVNDQGYAAETAAARTNNLKGDIERLGGSIQTAMIQMGAGADGPLRDLTQGLTGLIDRFNSLPDAVQQGTLVVAAIAGAGALAAGGIIKTAVATGELISAMRQISPLISTASLKFEAAAVSGTKLGTAIRGIGVAAGAAGIALAALAIAGAVSDAAIGKSTPNVERYAAALELLGAGGADSMRSLTDAIASSGLSNQWLTGLQTRVTDLSSAFRAFREDSADPWTNLSTGIAGLVGMDTQLGLLRENFAQMDEALTGMSKADAGAAFARIADQASQAGLDLNQTMGLFPRYRTELETLAAQLGVTGLTQQDYYGWMQGNVPAAVAAASAATGQNTEALTAQAAAATEAKQAITDLANAMLAQSGSLIGLEGAYDAATAAAKENGKTHDLNTEKGRANQSALDGIASSALKYADAATKAGTSTETVAGNVQRARDEFVATAQQMGYTGDQAKALADAYGLIPPSKTTQVTATGATAAKGEVDGLRGSIDLVTGKTVPVGETGAVPATGRVREMERSIDSVQGKTVPVGETGASAAKDRVNQLVWAITGVNPKSVSVEAVVSGLPQVLTLGSAIAGLVSRTVNVVTNYVTSGKPPGSAAGGLPIAVPVTEAHIGAPGFAGGGGWTGVGQRRVDRIPAWLSAHEFVQNDRAVDYYGLPTMYALNARRIPREVFSSLGFAGGGSPSGRESSGPTLPVLTGRDIEGAFRRALAGADVVVVRRSDFSLLGGGV